MGGGRRLSPLLSAGVPDRPRPAPTPRITLRMGRGVRRNSSAIEPRSTTLRRTPLTVSKRTSSHYRCATPPLLGTDDTAVETYRMASTALRRYVEAVRLPTASRGC